MAARKASRYNGADQVENRPEMIDLCENCEYPDCIAPDRGCALWRSTRAALLKGDPPPEPIYPPIEPRPEPRPREETRGRHYNHKNEPVPEYTPPIMLEEVPAGPPDPAPAASMDERSLLMLYNLSIDALEKLMSQIPDIDWPPHLYAGCESLKNDRMRRFAHLIDWAAIAKRGTKK